MNRLLLVVLASVAVAAAYDFRDEAYNQVLRQEIDELETSGMFDEQFVNVRRRKRDEEAVTTAASADKTCKKRRWKMCCGEEIIERIMEKDREMKKECFKDVMASSKDDKSTGIYDPFSCEKVNKIRKEWTCVVQCVGQKKNIIDDDGNFKDDELKEYYKKELANEEWLYKLIETAYPKCLEQAKNGSEFVKDKEDPLSCNPVGIKMHHCMWRELQLTCPDDKITDTKTCSKIREKIKNNNFLPFRHHHHHDDE